jgi:hypothetical protein
MSVDGFAAGPATITRRNMFGPVRCPPAATLSELVCSPTVTHVRIAKT